MQEHRPLIIQPADPEQDPEKTLPALIEDDPAPVVVAEKVHYVPNRHDRRRAAALARKERREKQKAKP